MTVVDQYEPTNTTGGFVHVSSLANAPVDVAFRQGLGVDEYIVESGIVRSANTAPTLNGAPVDGGEPVLEPGSVIVLIPKIENG